ncbi:MAG: hypothetical protein FWE31_01930 [Firmicutes bacterium]|nr:hypothetical protein [Bacillota bacterium]
MFSFYSNSSGQPIAQARSEREEASIRSLREAFGSMEGIVAHRDERPGVSDATQAVRHMVPPGHRLEEHHIHENCTHGRRRKHTRNMPEPPHDSPCSPQVGVVG